MFSIVVKCKLLTRQNFTMRSVQMGMHSTHCTGPRQVSKLHSQNKCSAGNIPVKPQAVPLYAYNIPNAG